jgi:RNA polymerase sigma factor (sigma-70 family)
MSLLDTLLALKQPKASRQDCDALMRDLCHRLDGFRGMVQRMVNGTLAQEDDIMSEVAQAIYEHIAEFRGNSEGEAVNYCKGAVQNKTLDYVRRAKGRLIFVSGCTDAPHTSELPDDDPVIEPGHEHGQADDPLEAVARQELAERLLQALDALTPGERYVVWQTVVRERQIVDLSAETGLKQNTLTRRKLRGLAKLAELVPRHLLSLYRTDGAKSVSRSSRHKSPKVKSGKRQRAARGSKGKHPGS